MRLFLDFDKLDEVSRKESIDRMELALKRLRDIDPGA
jgi:hypothetical protein